MGVRELKKTKKISEYSCKLYLQRAIYFWALSFVQLSSHCFLYHSHPLALFSSIRPVFLSTLLPFSLAVSHFLLFLRLHSDCPHFGSAFRSESLCSSIKIPFFLFYLRFLCHIYAACFYCIGISFPFPHTWSRNLHVVHENTRGKMKFQLTDNNQLYPFNTKMKLSNPNSSQGLTFCPQNCGQSQLCKYIYVPTTCLIHSSHKHTDSLPYIDKRCVEISPGTVVLSRPMWKRI